MKRALGFAYLALIVLGLIHILSPRLEAQNNSNQPRDGACFYMDSDYRGDSFCMNAGESLRNVEDRYNDKISSVRVFGNAQVIVYEHDNFGGASRTLTGDVPNLRDWNDKITSFQVSGGQYGGQSVGQYGSRSSGNEPRNGACFYLDADYRGERFCVDSDESQQNLGERYNDRVSSIRIFGGAEVTVYDDENFNGSRQTFRQDVPNLRDWSDRITSFQVTGGQYGGQSAGRYRGRSSGNEPRNGACFYLDEEYRGESFCVNSDESQQNLGERYNDRVSSIRIFGGAELTVYDDENFNGSRQTFRQNVPKLRDWSDRITSLQVTGGRYGGQSVGQYGGQSSGYEPRDGVCFYMDADHRGDSFCMNAGESLRNVEDRYNDKISSVRVFGRARVTVYENENFRGASRTLTSDVSNLGNFNDKITSIEVR